MESKWQRLANVVIKMPLFADDVYVVRYQQKNAK